MDEDISIINSNTRNEKIKNFLLNNKNKFVSILIIIIVCVIGAYGYDKYITDKKKKISDNYNFAIIDYSDNNKEATTTKLINIINQKDPTYSPLSLYFIIDNNLISDHKKINDMFDILIKSTSLDEEIKNLVIYKKALYNADRSSESDLLNMLNTLINSDTVWKSHALYLIAEYFYAQDQKQKSKEFFNKIISLETSNSEIKKKSEQRLIRDLSE